MTERLLVTGGSGFIGSHLIDEIARRNHQVINLDIKPPSVPGHEIYWRQCDIKDEGTLAGLFRDFLPTRVIHLAAKANLNGMMLHDFPDNTLGTTNIVECVNSTDSIELFVNTSTQYVVMPGVLPADETYLEPYTAYGESKAAAERIVREYCRRRWTIIRPTNIWGPRHVFFPNELWRYLEHRYYIHPGFRPVFKYYGYVGNAVQQILQIGLSQPAARVAGKVWYITDGAIDNAVWMNEFSLRLSGKRIRRVPLPVWRIMAKAGDVLQRLGMKFPMNSGRLFRLTVSETIPEELIPRLPKGTIITLQEGMERSVSWYRSLQCEDPPRGDE